MLKNIKNYKWILLASVMLLVGGVIAGCGETKKDPTDDGGTPSGGGAGNVPVGAVMYFAMQNAPEGWLVCDGKPYSIEKYKALFTAIGGTFGGDGTNTFAVPDLRGEFIRGWDNGRKVDEGRQFGSSQADMFKSHNHRYYLPNNTGFGQQVPPAQYTDWRPRNIEADTEATGGTETRPRNVALLPCIKY